MLYFVYPTVAESKSSQLWLINARYGEHDLSILEVIESECKPPVTETQGAFSIG